MEKTYLIFHPKFCREHVPIKFDSQV